MAHQWFQQADYDAMIALASDQARHYLQQVPDRPVRHQADRERLLSVLGGPLATSGAAPEQIVRQLADTAHWGNVACNSPRYFGFVIGGAYPVSLAADWLVSTWDQNAGIYAISPMVSVIEEVAANWLLDLFGLPSDAGVGFVTGCQMANFTCLAAARHGVLRRIGVDVEAEGLAGSPRVHVVTSAESHVTIDIALRYLGFGTRHVHRVAADAQGRMRPDALAALLETLSGPIIVCAQAGNVNTGSFDPLAEIAALTNAKGAWLHVDGAFGLWAQASPELRHLSRGIELADSWSTDAHKWLNVPYDCGIAIVRHADDHRAAMMSTAAYLVQTAGKERDPTDWGPEFSRRARSVPVYATLANLGRAGVAALVERSCARARQFASLLAGAPGVEILNDVVLNQVLVRFDQDDTRTRAVIAAVQQEGTCWLGGTIWHGMAAMRISVSNWATSETDVAHSAEAILRCHKVLGASQSD